MPRKRSLAPFERDAFLRQAGPWRDACNGMSARSPIGDAFYKAVSGITAAIDGLAEAVTGDQRHFHAKPPEAPAGARKRLECDEPDWP